MEIDGTSSASNDSNSPQFSQLNANYYGDNLYYNNLVVQSKKSEFQNYFEKSILEKHLDTKDLKKLDYCNNVVPNLNNNIKSNSNNNNNNNTMGPNNENPKSYEFENNGAFGAKKMSEVDDNKKSHYFIKKGEENKILLNNVDNFGKKSVSFTPDQVS